VVLRFLCRSRINNLVVLLLQILQYITDFASCALDILIKFASGLDCRDCRVGSSK
jgi:hypothetical protein